jgi:hypothetical protein
VRDRRRRPPASLPALVFWPAAVWGGMVVARSLGVPIIVLVLVAVVVLDVAAFLWGYDSRDGRDWPARR